MLARGASAKPMTAASARTWAITSTTPGLGKTGAARCTRPPFDSARGRSWRGKSYCAKVRSTSIRTGFEIQPAGPLKPISGSRIACSSETAAVRAYRPCRGQAPLPPSLCIAAPQRINNGAVPCGGGSRAARRRGGFRRWLNGVS